MPKQIQFERPHFITPHAVNRFKARVADISERAIIIIIQAALQKPGEPMDVEPRGPIYAARYHGKSFYIPVTGGDGSGNWPTVPTILGEESLLHGKACRGGVKRGRATETQNDNP